MAIDPFNGSSSPKQQKYSPVETVVLNMLFVVSFPVVFLLRTGFGERFLKLFHSSFTSLTIWVIWFITLGLAPVLVTRKDTVLTWFYLLLVAVMASIHAVEITLRADKGVKIHSYYTGKPRLLKAVLMLPEWLRNGLEWLGNLEVVTKLYIEPCLCLVAGCVLFFLEPFLGMIVILGGVGVLVLGQYKLADDRDKYLDMIDAQIEAEQMQEMLSGKYASENHGLENYAAPRAKVVSTRSKPSPNDVEDGEDDSGDELPAALAQLLNEEEEEEDEDEDSTPRAEVVKVNVSSRKEEILPVKRKGRPRKTDVTSTK